MTGRGHRLTGIGAGFAAAALARLWGWPLELELTAGVVAAAGTTIPDWTEIPIIRNGLRVGSIIPHRTITHWGLMWGALLMYALMGWGAADYVSAILAGAAVGAIFHLIGDAPNPMGVPWLLPHRRMRMGKGGRGLWRSGQYELAIIVVLGLVGWAFWWFAGTVNAL